MSSTQSSIAHSRATRSLGGDAADLLIGPGGIPRDEIIESACGALTVELQPGEEWGLGPNHARLTDESLDAIGRPIMKMVVQDVSGSSFNY